MKPVVWLGDSLDRLREFPAEARHDLGYDLEQVQGGDAPKDWKPMPSIGPGVIEIRVRAGGAYRLIYIAGMTEAIYVVHVFQKKSRKTSRTDVELARTRVRKLLQEKRQS